ncbi:MAG: hypothetical protein KME32_13540 [Mojavia pulchra JT2-VF2]|jgi:hypothetical protein|uniref:Uncharacterized protein n=1 Tax=Mojavia pulchra JT2-VF2 TaxID=287848 RepID=A0A951PYA0_9NOST|nr:hypothetical protein [Mojavia pulchra JT2-VF2]
MFYYIQIVNKRWNNPEPSANKAPTISKPSEVEEVNEKSSEFAKAKSTEYIRNAQQNYYLERRLFC